MLARFATGAARPEALRRLLSLTQQQPQALFLSTGAKAVTAVEQSNVPTTNSHGAAFPDDLRSTSGIGRGDGMDTHTSKWLSEGREGPMEMIQRIPPAPVKANVVACRGGQSQLGHPVEFIKVLGTTLDEPATCKYCGLRYYHDHDH